MRSLPFVALAIVALIGPLAAACGSDSGEGSASPGPAESSSKPPGSRPSTDDDAGAGASACPRAPKAADRTRKVVVSHPFAEGGAKATAYEVLELSTTGELTKTNEKFQMGRGLSEIAFTPDGEIGLTAQDDGSLGVFKIDADGKLSVVHAAFKGTFYAQHVVVSHDGSRAFVVDPNTKDNRGGVYEVAIGCDGTLTDRGLVVPGGKAHAMALVPTDPERAVLIGGAAFESPAADYAHVLDLAKGQPTRVAGGSVFPTEAIASWVAITPDGKWALVTDNSFIAGNRMAAVELATMKSLAPIAVSNPAAVVMSPFGNAALLLESDGEDHLRLVTYDAASATKPFSVGAEVSYVGGKTQLPVVAIAVDRGALKGRVLVAENLAVRQLAFAPGGSIADLGTVPFAGVTGIVGSVGVEP